MWKFSILSQHIIIYHIKSLQNQTINEDWRGRRGTKQPNSFQKVRLFLKIKDFQSTLIILEAACKILKSLKCGNLVLQLPKIWLLQTGAFLRIQNLKLLFDHNFSIFTKNHTFFFKYNVANTTLSINWDLVDQNLLRIELENEICKLSQRKEQSWWLHDCCFSRTKKVERIRWGLVENRDFQGLMLGI